jgi:choline dehydrogenase
VKRRDLFKLGLAISTIVTGRARPGASAPSISSNRTPAGTASGGPDSAAVIQSSTRQSAPPRYDADYIVVGSGAGGGTLAARLAEAGFTVLLLEAGGDPKTSNGSNPLQHGGTTLPEDYDVPAFHALSTENDAMKWDFFVRHYADDERQKRDSKYLATHDGKPVDGVLYPRAGTLGGCTAHNAMILVCPPNADWNELADLTGDPSWHSDRMRTYFERLENCRHRPFERFLSKFGINPSRHGWSGWLDTERTDPAMVLKDRSLGALIVESVRQALKEVGRPIADDRARLDSQADPNDWRFVEANGAGVRYTPLTTRNHARVGTRERVLDVQRRHPEKLKIELHALATRVVFDDNNRAIGVEYLKGERLYRAHATPNDVEGERRTAYAAREVVLAGGAFNTPQLLMLSGIGPRATLEAHRIPVRADVPGVGRNLQDRYEVAVVNRMAFPAWPSLAGATFTRNDQQYREWSEHRTGVYTTSGAVLSVILSSSPGRPSPDLFCYAIIADFFGYFPGYSKLLPENPNCLTWVVLKGHTNNTAGEVTLRSADPRDPPLVNFRYFDEGNDADDSDLKSVVAGVGFVRRLAEGLSRRGMTATEERPGASVRTDAEIEQYVRDNAWGHHASCTCPIGPLETGGVLSTDFKVHKTQGLRVVDASVFPRVPGLFIVSAVYMIGEKAADVIIADARRR